MIFCHKCGSEQLEGSEFCRKCGARLIAEENSGASEQPVNNDAVTSNIQYTSNSYNASTPVMEQSYTVQKKSHTKLIILIAVCVLILAAASVVIALIISNSNSDNTKETVTYYDSENGDSTDEVSEIIQNYFESDNKYLLMVKNGYRTDNPNISYEEAFEDFFADPHWKYFKSTEGQDVVEFTGECTYRDTPVKARLQFVVDEKKGTFEAHSLSFNEVPQNMITIASLIEAVFDEDDDADNTDIYSEPDNDDVNENTYSGYFTDSELYSIALKLGVPEDLDITFDVSEPHYWDGGDCYLCYVAVKHDGETIAGAEYKTYDASEPVKSISRY